ncbi:MAG: LysM peptidoglycan-binding domain-containing protein [Gammaproteobacteria bacterium]|nr:LysM peptidoglycan-binding domain-containing protein [Gammaproteobacteria bacterium]MDH5650464.1 LysM peptidoglycan-binding domain-containing protein [Gammaproteobacteria bacterium]
MANNITIKACCTSLLLALGVMLAAPIDQALAARAKTNKEQTYVVKKGDTLWDIASRFLHDPWSWPEVWHANPNIKNPHLIFPGDVVYLYFVGGKPQISVNAVPSGKKETLPPVTKPGLKTVKLNPRSHIQPLSQAITTIPREAIEPFLRQMTVLDGDTYEELPHIISSFEEHLIAGKGNKVYVANVPRGNTNGDYTIVRQGKTYRDPDSNNILGYEAIHVAVARVTDRNDAVTTFDVGETWQEVLNGDRVLPFEEIKSDFYFYPRSPRETVDGRIISVLGGVTMIGQYAVVVINKGENAGMVPGHVLAIYQAGADVRDSVTNQPVRLPDERAGILMVFKVFNKVSFGVVLETTRTLSLNDRVTNP